MLSEDRWATLAAVSDFSKCSAELVARLRDVSADKYPLPVDDLVHGDYNQANIVMKNNGVSSFVDTDEIGTGARAFDLTDLYHRSLLSGDPPRGRELLREVVTAQVGVEGFQQCFATTAIGTLRWMIERTPDRVEARIQMLNQELDRRCIGLM